MSRSRFKNVDFYRKIPKDMTEGTIPGSVISVLASGIIAILLVSEIGSYLTPTFDTKVVVDRSQDGDLMRINFNVSFPALSCEFASVDVGDVMGLNRYNLTKTVFKRAIDASLNPLGPIQWERGEKPKEIDHGDERKAKALVTYHEKEKLEKPEKKDHPEPVLELTAKTFAKTKAESTVLLVNFYAPWCPWSRRLDPVWKASALQVHEKFPKSLKNRVVVAEVDCTKHEPLCRDQHVQGYPSVRVYSKSSGGDDPDEHDHVSYHGDRTVEAITKFALDLLPEWKANDPKHADSVASVKNPAEKFGRDTVRKIDGPGCSVTGFVLVKKVPGHLWITASSDAHSFHPEEMNMTHDVHHFYFGQQLSPQRRKYLEKFHSSATRSGGGAEAPRAIVDKRARGASGSAAGDWHDKLAGETYVSEESNVTHEHYLQTVLTTIKPWGAVSGFNVYEYTQHSHAMKTASESPRAKFHFDPSPVQIYVSEERQKFYHFITTLMAIVGGVYSVMGIADGFVHNGMAMIRKANLGKQG